MLVTSLTSASCQAQAVASPTQVSFGSDVSALDQQRAYLEKYFLSSRAEDVARYQLPVDLALRVVDVDVQRIDIPERLRRQVKIAVPCVVAPHRRDHWVMVPGLMHTFHVARGEDLDTAIRSEVARVTAAAEPSELDLRRLFPAEDTWLEYVSVGLLVGVDGLAGRARAVRKRRIEEHKTRRAREILEQAGHVISGAKIPPGPPLVGRDGKLRELDRLLRSPARASMLLVGDESVGKSALLQQWCRTTERTPRLVLSTSVAQLIAGASDFGEWQERLANVLDAAERLDAVLYFENFAELFGERPERGGIDIAGGLRRYIVDQRVRVIGELSGDMLERARKHHVAMFGAMSELRLEPLDSVTTLLAVEDRITYWRRSQPHRPSVADNVAQPVVELAERYMRYRAFPGKAIGFLEELRATRETRRGGDGEHIPIGLEDCYDAFSLSTGIPGFLLREDRPLVKDELVAAFRKRMIGQEEAVARVAETVCLVKARLQPEQKPLATFLFVGPTGVGKTELARTVTDYLFGAEDRMARFDMSEYTDPIAGERLIRGTQYADGLLTSKVRQQPFCVLLLDEIEKAHPAVHDLLLQVCGEGRLTDARGRTTYFDNAIIIMTSNVGASHHSTGLGIAAPDISQSERYARAVRDTFRPEMLNRLDRIVAFSRLTTDEIARVARIAIDRVSDRRGVQESGLALSVSESALAQVSQGGYSETYGVRALRRHIDDTIVTPLAHELARLGAAARGASVWIGTADEVTPTGFPVKQRLSRTVAHGLRMELFRRAAAVGRVALRGVSSAGGMRRECDRLAELDEVVDLREQVSNLRAQLTDAAVGPGKRKRSRKRAQALGAELEGLRIELHRKESAWTGMQDALADVYAAEELAITSVLDGEDAGDFAREMRALFRRFRRAFFWVLVAGRAKRNQVTIRVRRVKGAAPFRLWLLPMLEWANQRQWSVCAHLPGEKARGWPEERLWGPAHTLEWLEGKLRAAPDVLDRMLLRVEGADSALLLAAESGMHRFRGFSNNENGDHMSIDVVALGTQLSDRVWVDPVLAEPAQRTVARKVELAREREKGSSQVRVTGTATVDIDEYKDDYFAAIEELALDTLLVARGRGGIDNVFAEYVSSLNGEP